eukprot:Blabericola_migrator_1__2741@NODE_1781_length_3801_cov_113_225228_g1147_i0_p3_GENE_NODE_1781_length_3801_cov_113_225228_g1147_i0NODE_1781_length_3801_cov_113_225228_g1147_i0_p3_ORF_typecomplete_len258_score17_03AKAP95/PF04988_12/0_27_NODE_1781_length_3801_cov_113_225228_g1147_i026623435
MKVVILSELNSAFRELRLEPAVAFFSALICSGNAVPDDATEVWHKLKHGCGDLLYTHRLPIQENTKVFDMAMAQLVAIQNGYLLKYEGPVTWNTETFLPYTIVKQMRMTVEDVCNLRSPWSLKAFLKPEYQEWLPLLYQIGPVSLTDAGLVKFQDGLPLEANDFIHTPPPETVSRLINEVRTARLAAADSRVPSRSEVVEHPSSSAHGRSPSALRERVNLETFSAGAESLRRIRYQLAALWRRIRATAKPLRFSRVR